MRIVALGWWLFFWLLTLETYLADFNIDSIPNPFTNPIECHRAGFDHSWLCDPKGILQPEEANVIEQSLTRFRDTTQHPCANGELHFYQLALVVLDTLDPNVNPNIVSDQLLHRWGIGTCNDGLLLLVVVQDKVSSLSWRPGVNPQDGGRPAITPYFEQRLKASIFKDLRSGKTIADVIVNAVESIREQLPVWKGKGSSKHTWMWWLLGGMALIYFTTLTITYLWFRTIVKTRYQESRSFIDTEQYDDQADLYPVINSDRVDHVTRYGT